MNGDEGTGTIKKILCCLLTGFFAGAALALDLTDEQGDEFLELNEVYTKGAAKVLGMHPMVFRSLK